MTTRKKYQILEHTADLAIKGYDQDLAGLFSHLAEGMYAVITANAKFSAKGGSASGGKIQNAKLSYAEQIRVKGESVEELLVNWLNELLFLTETKHQIYHHFQFYTISDRELYTSARTTPLSSVQTEIKAATFHDLKIKKTRKGYEATVTFDI